MSEYTKSSKATSNDLWGHQVAEGGKSRALRLREEDRATPYGALPGRMSQRP